MFKNILCPLDLKPRSRMALKEAISIAHQFNSKIILLNIHEEFMSKNEMIMSRVSVSKLGDEFKKMHPNFIYELSFEFQFKVKMFYKKYFLKNSY